METRKVEVNVRRAGPLNWQWRAFFVDEPDKVLSGTALFRFSAKRRAIAAMREGSDFKVYMVEIPHGD